MLLVLFTDTIHLATLNSSVLTYLYVQSNLFRPVNHGELQK